MPSSFPRLLIAVLALAGVAPRAHAGRAVLLPPYRLATLHDFRKNAWDLASGIAEGEDLLVGILLQVDIANLTGVVQSGTFEFQQNATTTYEVAKASECCPGRYMQTYLTLCSGTDGQTVSQPGSAQTGTAISSPAIAWPQPIRWTLPANKGGRLHASAVFTGKFSNTDVTKFDAAFVQFVPTLRITVDQDRGAVIGSMAAQFLSTSGTTTCGTGGVTLSGLYGKYLNDPGAGPVIHINGGRAF